MTLLPEKTEQTPVELRRKATATFYREGLEPVTTLTELEPGFWFDAVIRVMRVLRSLGHKTVELDLSDSNIHPDYLRTIVKLEMRSTIHLVLMVGDQEYFINKESETEQSPQLFFVLEALEKVFKPLFSDINEETQQQVLFSAQVKAGELYELAQSAITAEEFATILANLIDQEQNKQDLDNSLFFYFAVNTLTILVAFAATAKTPVASFETMYTRAIILQALALCALLYGNLFEKGQYAEMQQHIVTKASAAYN